MTSDENMAGPFRPLSQRRAFEEILQQVEQAIVTGQLEPGDRLPGERELAETFGVSRASVREALRVLEMFGVVIARRGTGADAGSTVASDVSSGLTTMLRLHSALLRISTEDFVDIRIVLECHAARHAAARLDPDSISELRRIIKGMRDAASPDEFHAMDTSFHVELGRASGNALAPLLMEGLRGSMSREMLRGWAALDDWQEEERRVIGEHEQIVDRIEAGDGDGAAAILREHLLGFERRLDGIS